MQIVRTLIVFSAGGLIAASLASCDDAAFDPVICPAMAIPAIRVEVRDVNTHAPAAAGAGGLVRDGSYADTLRLVGFSGPPSDETALILAAAHDRSGTYDVTVTKPGYQSWSEGSVHVPAGVCGPLGVKLDAFLTPQ